MQGTIKAIYKIYPFLAGILLFISSWQFYRENNKSVIWADAEGYYLYLPAVFIYDGFEHVPIISGQMQPYKNSNKIYTKYTCGIAMMELPFFALAQAGSYIFGKDLSGYSAYNNLALRLAAIFYVVWGLFLLKNYLEHRFRKLPVFIALQALLWGTNLFYYTVREPGMSHAYLFFLFAAFIVFTPRFLQAPSVKNTIFVGLLLGLITLIRPTNCLIALYLLLYNVNNWRELAARVRFFIVRMKRFWIIPVIMFLVFVPQLIYWHYISGSFIIYSYEQEGFIYWKAPKILLVLFDVQNGWLLYSPAAIFALLGLVWAIAKKEPGALPISIILVIATYIFSSWWAWWFGGAFGHRCFVEFYALLAMPFTFFMQKVWQQNKLSIMLSLLLLISILVFYNLRLSYLYVSPWDGPDWTWSKYGEVLKQAFYL